MLCFCCCRVGSINLASDFLFVVETWLTPKFQDALLCPLGYSFIRKDRITKRGGGVLVLYKNNLTVIDISKTDENQIEHISIEAKFPNSKESFRILCVYIPPDASTDKNVITRL